MPFKPLLQELMDRVPGSSGAIVADWEGEAVDRVSLMDDYQLRVIGAHKGIILGSLRQAMSRLQESQLQEVVIATSDAQMLVLPVTHDYFLVLVTERGAVVGQALYNARRCVTELKKEIA